MPRYRYSWDHDRPNRPAHRVTDTNKTKPSESVRKQLARDINIDVTQRGDLAPRCRHAPNPVGQPSPCPEARAPRPVPIADWAPYKGAMTKGRLRPVPIEGLGLFLQ